MLIFIQKSHIISYIGFVTSNKKKTRLNLNKPAIISTPKDTQARPSHKFCKDKIDLVLFWLKLDSLFFHSCTIAQPGACLCGPAGGHHLICLDPCLKSVCTTQGGKKVIRKRRSVRENQAVKRTRGCLWCESE